MKRSVIICAAAVCSCLLGGGLHAGVITLAPGNGVSTNVTERIVGANDVVVNEGATGGGIVTLANSYNSYTGATTLNCGTLVATALGGDAGSSLGLSSGLTLGAGTFRYAGADGGYLPISVESAFVSASTKSTVLDVQSDLVVTTNWTQKYGTFIKTGPGTVTFRGKYNFFGAASGTQVATSDDRTHRLALNANGDAPTTGVRGGFVLAEGKMVIEGDDSTTNYFNSSTSYGAIGTWTAADGEQEKSAVLEIRGGYNIMPRACWLAYHNGTAATGGDNVSSGLRVTGGYLRIGMPDVPVSGNETIFVGGQTSPNGPQRSNPFIEVTGGTLNVGKNLQLGNQGGVNTRVSVSGDGRLIIGQNVGNVYSATTTTSTNSVTVSENGVLEAQCIQMLNNSVGSQCDVRLLDNALYAWTVTNKPAFNKESSNKGVMNVLIDGGTVSNSFKATKAHEVAIFHANTDRVAIGTRGATFVNGADSTAQYIFGLRVPFVATNTVEGMERQPVNLLAANEVGQKKTTYRFYSAFNWPYSVRLGPFAYIYVQSGAKFATDGKFIHCRAARLISNVDVLTFKDYQIGEVGDTVDDAATVFLSAGTHIVVTNSFRKASETTRLHVYMAKAGTGWTSGGSEFTTPGDYTVLVVPESSRADLERLASTATYAHANKCRSGFHVVDNGDGTLALKLCILSSASGATTTVTDFVDGAELGLGTLEYAGAGEETTGFTLNALGAAVLKTSAPLTVTEGVDTAVGALIKTGAADLRLEGSGSYSFAGAGVEWSATAADNEIGANGESPVAGYKGLSVREGRVVVGRQPDDAPTVTVSALSVGSNPAETDIPAELIVSNGIVKVYGEARLSPAQGKQNRIELSGGTLSVDSTFRPGNMPGMDDVAGATPGLLVVNDGGHLVLNGTGGLYNGDMGEMELILNEGGVVSAYSNFQGTKESVPYRGTLRFNGGVYSYAVPDLAPYLRYVNVFVGAKGAVFDGEERFANGGIPTANYLHIAGTWAKDPSLGGEPDGGITFRGRAFFYFGGAFTSSIEGPVVVQDQAQLMSIRSAASGMSVSVKPGCGIRSYQNSANYVSMFKDLALGEAGTPGHVRLEIRGLSDARSIYSIVVSNEFATLSPVCFSGRSTYGDLVPSFTTGTYTALVYRAESDANVDLAKFYLDPELSNRTATFSKADISGGAYAGWKAIVVNVAEGSGAAAPVDTSGYARWTATAAGGGWSSPGNWENGVLPDASHLAVFGAPGAAGVAVNLDVEPALEKLYIEGSDAGKGYAFGGSRPLGFDGGAFGSALLEIAGGSHAFTAPLKIDRLLTMNAAAGSTVEIAATTGGGTLKLNASGDAKTGKVVVGGVGGALAGGFGRTEVDDISFARESGKLMLGSGTLAYTGATPADDVHLALAPNLANANTAVVFENAADVRVTEVTGGASCALIKTGAGDLSIGGTLSAEFKGTVARANASSDLIADSGNAPTTGFRGLNAAEGTIAIGAVGDAANAPSVKSDNISIGLVCSPVSLGAPVELVMNNGTLAITSHLLLGNFMTWQSGVADVRYVQNGGTASAANVYIGYAGSGDATQAVNGEFTLNDGEFSVSGTLYASHGRRKFETQANNAVTINGGVMNV